MQNSKFGNNLKEAYVVLENLNMIQDLPREFMEFIIENKNDEYQFYYDVSKELIEQNISQETNLNSNQKININTATESELETISGVGQSTAKSIIEYRNKNRKV